MAEEYVIRITADPAAQEEKKAPVAMPNGSGVSAPPAPADTSANVGKMVAKAALAPALATLASTSVGMIGLTTGNNRVQQRMNLATSMISKGTSLYSTAATFAAVGGPAGAIAGVAAWTIGEAAQMSATAIRHNVEYRNECYKLGVTRERAGLTTNRRRR